MSFQVVENVRNFSNQGSSVSSSQKGPCSMKLANLLMVFRKPGNGTDYTTLNCMIIPTMNWKGCGMKILA
jgi:hypothetical protein